MIKIYVAAPWAEKAFKAKEAKEKLEAEGFIVTSRWISFHEEKSADQSGLAYDKDVLIREAANDVEDVRDCDIVILLNTQKRGEETSGKAVETGMALAWFKPIIVVGQPTNVFHWLMPIVDSVEDAIALIREWVEAKPKIEEVQSPIIITG
jgi:nucleoside 2-deoxyribosyltransferase